MANTIGRLAGRKVLTRTRMPSGEALAMSWNKNRVTSRLGITYPIIQGPLGGLASQRLVAAVSNYGGLGSFGAHSLKPQAIREIIGELRSITAKPFAVNLWVSMEDEGAFLSDANAFERSLAHISGHIKTLGGELPTFTPYSPARFEDQVRVIIDEKVPVLSFICGLPPAEILDECRRGGIVLIGGATTVDEAKVLADAGVDLIVASGFEAGGHRGSFLRRPEESLMGIMALVPQVSDAVSLPVIAAGGIADGRGIVAALALGAEGVQMGTIFLPSKESGASELHRHAILSGKASVTALTRAFTGRLARGIENQLMIELNAPETPILPYPLQRQLIRNLTTIAESSGHGRLIPMWSGQSAGLVKSKDINEILDSLVDSVSHIAGQVALWRENG